MSAPATTIDTRTGHRPQRATQRRATNHDEAMTNHDEATTNHDEAMTNHDEATMKPRRRQGVTQMLEGTVLEVLEGPFDEVLAQALRRSLEIPCLMVDPELFFAESPEGVETAKAMCAECPVRDACLQGALERREPWGVWGAELFVQGEIVARKRPRGRPRKDVAA